MLDLSEKLEKEKRGNEVTNKTTFFYPNTDSLITLQSIETRCQFHQRFTHAFFVQNFGAKNYKAVFWV